MSKSRVIVTGANGFVGKRLVKQLIAEKFEVVSMSSDMGDVADSFTWSNLLPVEIVFHLAARSFVPESWVQPQSFFKTNLLGSVCALEYCKQHKAKLVYVSSYLYGNPTLLPILESAPLQATNPYALTKKMTEEVCRFYSDNFGTQVVVLRPFNVYGSGQSLDFLIPSIISQAIAGTNIVVNDLSPKRDYIFVDDLVNAILKAAEVKLPYSVFNIGTGNSYSVAKLIDVIQKCAGSSQKVVSRNHKRAGEIMDTVADIELARDVLKWQPKWTLEKGIEATVADIRRIMQRQ